jgi:hypothetical protein
MWHRGHEIQAWTHDEAYEPRLRCDHIKRVREARSSDTVPAQKVFVLPADVVIALPISPFAALLSAFLLTRGLYSRLFK